MIERQLTLPNTIELVEEKLNRSDVNSIIGLARMADPGKIVPYRQQVAHLESLSDPQVEETSLFLARSAFQAINYLDSDTPVVGFASTRISDEGVHIEDLFVHPMSRNRSIGRKLVEACIDYAEHNNARFVQVTRPLESLAAKGLFTALDFMHDNQGKPRRKLR